MWGRSSKKQVDKKRVANALDSRAKCQKGFRGYVVSFVWGSGSSISFSISQWTIEEKAWQHLRCMSGMSSDLKKACGNNGNAGIIRHVFTK